MRLYVFGRGAATPEVIEGYVRAVIGAPHRDYGEGVVAVVVPEAGARLDEKTILDALAGGLARFKQPKAVIFRTSLPRNTMGKVQKNLLRDEVKAIFTT